MRLMKKQNSPQNVCLAYVKSNTVVGDSKHSTGVVLAEIVRANIPVRNGVVHLIHRPLMVVDTTVMQFLEVWLCLHSSSIIFYIWTTTTTTNIHFHFVVVYFPKNESILYLLFVFIHRRCYLLVSNLLSWVLVKIRCEKYTLKEMKTLVNENFLMKMMIGKMWKCTQRTKMERQFARRCLNLLFHFIWWITFTKWKEKKTCKIQRPKTSRARKKCDSSIRIRGCAKCVCHAWLLE